MDIETESSWPDLTLITEESGTDTSSGSETSEDSVGYVTTATETPGESDAGSSSADKDPHGAEEQATSAGSEVSGETGAPKDESFVYDASGYTYVAEGEYYYDVASVVIYLDEYGELPANYITKDEAEEMGWRGGSVEDYVDGAAIGGDHFGNYDGLLPKGSYHECDIDTDGYHSRGSRRLIYSDDGKYYYTADHYRSFTELTVPECEMMLSEGQ